MNESFESGTEYGVYYIGLKICNRDALKSMRVLFERIRSGIWSDEEKYPEIHRIKFNERFKHINLWSTSLENSDLKTLREKFSHFAEKHANELESLTVDFTKLKCKVIRNKIYVGFQLHKNSQDRLQNLQEKIIRDFKKFQSTDFRKPYDLHCSLLYVNTKFPLKYVERIISAFMNDGKIQEVHLKPLILSHKREILCEFPMATELYREPSRTAEWERSLCLMDFPDTGNDDDCMEIIRSLSKLSSYTDYEPYMIESCKWETEFYEKSRIVAVFRKTRLRDDFYRYFMKYLASVDYELYGADVIATYSNRVKVGVYKALTREKDSLHFYAEEACCKSLPNYRSRVDNITLELYLKQLDEPYRKHYFETRDDFDQLLEVLKNDDGIEYLSSVC